MSFLWLNILDWTAITAIATVVLALGAVITSIFAIRAFGKQSAELGVLQKQAKDQADQLSIQREQAADQRKVNEKQVTVLELQARELAESLDERKRQAEEQRRAQAESVDLTWTDIADDPGSSLVVVINDSRRPIRSVTCVVYPEASDQTLDPTLWAEMYPPTAERAGWTFRDPAADGRPVIYALRAGGRAGFRFPRVRQDLQEAEVQFNDDAGLRWALNNELHLRGL
jgi:malate synthase